MFTARPRVLSHSLCNNAIGRVFILLFPVTFSGETQKKLLWRNRRTRARAPTHPDEPTARRSALARPQKPRNRSQPPHHTPRPTPRTPLHSSPQPTRSRRRQSVCTILLVHTRAHADRVPELYSTSKRDQNTHRRHSKHRWRPRQTASRHGCPC